MAWGIFNISAATYDSKSFNPAECGSAIAGIFFKPDGTKLYVHDNSSEYVYQYSLSTPWDLSTATYDSKSFSLTSFQYHGGLAFSADGSKMYATNNNATLYQYTLSTPWDISTAGTQVTKALNTGGYGASSYIRFSPDGTKFYHTSNGYGDKYIREYSLSTAWNIATLSYVRLFGDTFDDYAFWISEDGTKLYRAPANTQRYLKQYTLSTPFDISTASYDNNSLYIYLALGDFSNLYNIFFRQDDGSKMYLAGNSGVIYQYTTYNPVTFIPKINFIT